MVEMGGGDTILAWIMSHYLEASFMLVFGGMTVFFLIEPMFPRRENKNPMAQRWVSNILLAIMNFSIATVMAIFISQLLVKMALGFFWLQAMGLPLWGSIIVGIMAMEFMNYWLHRALHVFPWLWRLHMIHHSDTEIDVTTSHRHHPLEGLVSTVFVTPFILLLGAPVEAILIYNGLHTLLALTSHANIKIPAGLDAGLRLVIITPDFHRLHHVAERRFTDSNYGAIFPWFDYVFKTATRVPYNDIPQQEIGLEKWQNPDVNKLGTLLLLPFRKT